MTARFITLTTDYGPDDIYAGILKGVILSINSECSILDITHSVPKQDIRSAALALESAYRYFPSGTIHLAVVDPGVGSARRGIVVATDTCLFVGPDNGIFSFALTGPGSGRAYELTEKQYFLREISPTFHGRDIFAPAAAHLSRGVPPENLGRPIADPVILPEPAPALSGDRLEGRVLHLDRFGNIITNIRRAMLDGFIENGRIHASCRGFVIHEMHPFYAAAQDYAPFCLIGSSGRLEISVKNASAAALTGAQAGDAVCLKKI